MDCVIVDFEATCWEGSGVEEMEIIEIGAVYLDGQTLHPMEDFQQFVRPRENPVLSDFCRDLTHIEQNQIDSAPGFPAAYERFVEWMGAERFKLCSWGDFDLKLLSAELARHGAVLPHNCAGHVNLKRWFARAYSVKPGIGLPQAMRKSGFAFEGQPHRGIDDARNIARSAQVILPLEL